jgi:hypothetical protein
VNKSKKEIEPCVKIPLTLRSCYSPNRELALYRHPNIQLAVFKKEVI